MADRELHMGGTKFTEMRTTVVETEGGYTPRKKKSFI